MNKTLLPIRLLFITLCCAAGWLVCYAVPDWDGQRIRASLIGLAIGCLVVLVDLLLKGFSLRGLSAVTFGLAVGTVIAFMVHVSPLLSDGDPQIVFLVRLGLFLICPYLATGIALLRQWSDFCQCLGIVAGCKSCIGFIEAGPRGLHQGC